MSVSEYIGDNRFPTEEDFTSFFETAVKPLRDRLVGVRIGDIPESETARARFVVDHGSNVIDYYRERRELSPFGRQCLDAYVQKQSAR